MAKGKKKRKMIRADQLLVTRGLVSDIKEAQAIVMAGKAIIDDCRVDKAGEYVRQNASVRIKRRQEHQYVSRGGLKLSHALDHFKIAPSNLACLDVGASTGGFTDCLLQHGAKFVYAVDVGYGQLDWKLRKDQRVKVLERTHARDLNREHVPEDIDILVADVSFISLAKILSVSIQFLTKNAQMILLVKPQFEAKKEDVEAGGIVKNPAIHKEVCDRIADTVAALGFEIQGVIESPILGPHGNVEFLLYATR